MTRVLVSGASGIVGYGILRALRQARPECFLVGTSIYDDSVAPAFCDVFEQAPRTDDPGYLEWLMTTLKKHQINMLMPGIEADMYHWTQHATDIRAAGSMPLLNHPDLTALCEDKWAFFQHLKAAGIACAIDSALEDDFDILSQKFGMPLLLKPRKGFGSKGIVRASTREAFAPHKAQIGVHLMVQPLVGTDEEEFTISAFCDAKGGYFAAMGLRRKLSRDGFTDKAEVIDITPFEASMQALCQLFRPVGPTNFQFRVGAGGPKLLEINPRISSATSIRTAFGYNESAMALGFFLDGQIPTQPLIRSGRAVRYIDEHVFYEDSIHL
ncbi:ATP-grasp domain-containing protein [Roseovarius sp. LXJ103]|uniref:ATP-grasp domain-containing protein n=1 Tax=Roseovarius carneus TaxID=2853164 RepID=UPI000D60EAC1|nr:ATP-grasp domain-containing protein [Roseovarius carneus]MBZ8119935.1 ATP-grasp domain-containing protein [Roseovarius carneus]PWE34474.1 carbamoyl-phosphate synthase subunit L [Pelagicola sp. LXJ1103]